jgi:Fatty acid desaturase
MSTSLAPQGGALAKNQGIMRLVSVNAIALTFITVMTLGGAAYYAGAVIITGVFAFMDSFAGSEVTDPDYSASTRTQLNVMLYSVLPIMLWFGLCYAWYLGRPGQDLLGLGGFLKAHTGFDMEAVRAHTTLPELIVGGYCLGTIWAGFGTTVGHELTHRTWSPVALICGRWLLALTTDASFAIEHVYGHHTTLGTLQDPATARRGENVYHFIVRSTFGQIFSAWHIETVRLKRAGKRIHSWHNKMYRGWAMTLVYAAVFYAAAGWKGVAIFCGVSWFGKCYLEAINYIEHYGIVRVPGQPVEPRHSWNCNQRISSWLLFNLTRHSHHHAMGDKPYWELRSYPDAPMMPFGYLTMIYLALVPPLFFRIVNRKVLDWDRHYASREEAPLIEEANRRSRQRDFLASRAHLDGALAAAE